MPTYTTRLNLVKPASADNVDIDLVDTNFDLIDAAAGATVGLSSAKPASAFSGRMWYETNTGQFKINAAASASTMASWATLSPPGVFYVYNYGQVGTADDLATIQATINAAASAGGGYADLGPGSFTISDQPDIKQGVTLRGAGMGATTLLSASTASGEVVRLRGDSDVGIQDLTVDVNNRVAIGILVQLAASATVATRHSIRRVRVKNALNNVVRVPTNPTLDFTVEDCVFEDSRDGITIVAAAASAHKDIHIQNNKYRRLGYAAGFSHGVQLFGTAIHQFVGVNITGNDMRDWTAPETAIPIEVNYTTEATIDNNIIGSSATRGIGAGNSYNVTIADNTIVGQSIYAMELGNLHGFSITGNTASACASFFHETSSALEDGVITANTYIGSPASSAIFGGNVMKMPWAKKVRISNNEFHDWQYLREAVRVGEAGTAEEVSVSDNDFYITDVNTPILAVNLCRAVRSGAEGNRIYVKRSLVAGDDYAASITLHNNVESSDLTVENNKVYFTAATSAAPNASGIGHNGNIAAFAQTGTAIRGNRVAHGPRGIRLVINSTDLIVANNDTLTNTAADVIPATAVQAYQRPIYAGTGAPTIAGTTGDLYIRKDGGAGTWLYRCTSGTSWTAML